MNKVLFSKEIDNWKTPKEIYDYYMRNGFFDPCPYMSEFDGLEIEWKDKNFVNPPYSKIKQFVDKAIEEQTKNPNSQTILLIPARTDTKYFKKLVDYGVYIVFITGRLKFNEKGSAPFPSCILALTGNGEHNTICVFSTREELLRELGGDEE